MKRKNLSLSKKLILGKETISNLSEHESNKVRGGASMTENPCFTQLGSCWATQCQTECQICPVSTRPDCGSAVTTPCVCI